MDIRDNLKNNKVFDIYRIINKLKQKRKIFVSEADMQLELAWLIKQEYPQAKVRMEYCPSFDFSMHIDILVIYNEKWIPIELKYKTKGCKKEFDGEIYNLKNHGAKDVNCYLYLKDLQRIERIRNNVPIFSEGYTIFITNELSYSKRPRKEDCFYKQFSLENGITKSGKLDWHKNTSEGTKKNCEKPIVLEDEYTINWKNYSEIDKSSTGKFIMLINKTKGN